MLPLSATPDSAGTIVPPLLHLKNGAQAHKAKYS
jgi:hypothetical protein